MSSEQFEHIQKIRCEFRQAGESEIVKDSLNNAIQHLASELYKGDAHFIFELVQNAEDNTYEEPLPYLSFWLTRTDPTNSERSDGALIIENNEIGFKPDNVDAICQVGKTTKIKAQGYIGEKGIGFKSVFRITDNPYIFSNGYHFRLPKRDEQTGFGYIVPQWIDAPPEGLDLSVTHIVLPLTKPDFGYEDVEKMLRDIEPEIILFLSTLQEIRIKTDTGIDFTILKDDERLPEIAIDVDDNRVENNKSDDFLVCTKTFDKPVSIDHEKREGIESRDVTVALPLDKGSTAIGKIFAYLPVRSDSGLPFIVNADFILTSSREDLQDVAWNRWLIECMSDVVAEELLPLLKKHDLLKSDFLEAFAGSLNALSTARKDLFYPVFRKMCETLTIKDFLPTNEDDTYVSAQDGVLVGSGGLIDLLDSTQLSLLFQTPRTMDWIAIYINERLTPNLWQFLKRQLNVVEVDSEMFASKLSRSFLVEQCDSWFITFYKFLSIGGGRPPLSIWKPLGSPLRTKPILRLQDNSLVIPNESDVYLPMDVDSATSSQFIRLEIAQDEDARRFLKDLDVPEWDLVEEVLQQILPRYQNNPSEVSSAQYARDISKIRAAYATDSEMKKRQLRGKLMSTPVIFAENLLTKETVYLSPNHISFRADGLWGNFSGNYFSLSVQEEIHEFLRTLGVPEWDIVKEVIETILPKYRHNSASVSIDTYQSDFGKIELAFNTDSKEKQTQLRNELHATPFIRIERPDKKGTIYLKPDEVHFGTDGLWGIFSGSYFQVSVPEKTHEFLKKLGVSKWDITEEVIKTILPKYTKDSPTVPVDEHQSDFTKIELAFNTDSKEKQTQLRDKLAMIQFVLVEDSSVAGAIYRRPGELYFSTHELRMYFSGNNFRRFVNSKYHESANNILEVLGVADFVRVEHRKKNQRGHVVIANFNSYRQRGLDGFDPDIRVDGLKHAINNLTREKSEFIWNKIAKPNSDCIQGVVERTETQTYDASTTHPQTSKQFGDLLINTPWIPDSDGNMRKPNELSLDDLPESFIRDMWLANQLGMKEVEVTEFAEKSGIPIEAIRDLMENPEEYEKYKAWKAGEARQIQQPLLKQGNTGSKTIPHRIDYGSEFEDSFNRPGRTEVQSHIMDDGKVLNPKRRREKSSEEHHDRLRGGLSADDRRKQTIRMILEGPDPQVREYLFQMYGGKCQICNNTFPERDGKPFFVASYIVERQKSEGVDTSANALCLCADHFAKFKHGAIEGEDILIQIEGFQTESEGGNCKPILDVNLCGEKCEIRFKEKHLVDLQELIKASNDN